MARIKNEKVEEGFYKIILSGQLKFSALFLRVSDKGDIYIVKDIVFEDNCLNDWLKISDHLQDFLNPTKEELEVLRLTLGDETYRVVKLAFESLSYEKLSKFRLEEKGVDYNFILAWWGDPCD